MASVTHKINVLFRSEISLPVAGFINFVFQLIHATPKHCFVFRNDKTSFHFGTVLLNLEIKYSKPVSGEVNINQVNGTTPACTTFEFGRI